MTITDEILLEEVSQLSKHNLSAEEVNQLFMYDNEGVFNNRTLIFHTPFGSSYEVTPIARSITVYDDGVEKKARIARCVYHRTSEPDISRREYVHFVPGDAPVLLFLSQKQAMASIESHTSFTGARASEPLFADIDLVIDWDTFGTL